MYPDDEIVATRIELSALKRDYEQEKSRLLDKLIGLESSLKALAPLAE